MEITDFGSKIVGDMLEYLYSGELSEKLSYENLVEILKIAEKYNLKMLKSISEEKLILRLLIKMDGYMILLPKFFSFFEEIFELFI